MSSRSDRSLLTAIFLTVFVDLVGFSIIFPLFPDLLEHYLAREGADSLFGLLHSGLARLAGGSGEEAKFRTVVLFGGLIGSLYSALQFIFSPLWGRLSDRIGRKPVLTMTVSGLALSYLLWAFSGSFVLFLLSRVVGGVMSGNISVATAAVADATGSGKRSGGMAMVGVAFGLGFLFGPALGGLLARFDLGGGSGADFGIHPFTVAAGGAFLLSVANIFWIRTRLRETLPPEARAAPAAGDRPTGLSRVLRRFPFPGVNQALATWFVYMLAFAGMEFTLTFLVKERFGYDRTNTHWIFVYSGVILILVQGGLVRRLVPRLGDRRVAILGLALVAAGLPITAVAGSEPVFYTGLGLLAAGSGLVSPTFTALTSLYSPAERQGEVLGVFRSLGALARAVGPLAACAIYWELGSALVYYIAAGILVVSILIATRTPEPKPVPESGAPGS